MKEILIKFWPKMIVIYQSFVFITIFIGVFTFILVKFERENRDINFLKLKFKLHLVFLLSLFIPIWLILIQIKLMVNFITAYYLNHFGKVQIFFGFISVIIYAISFFINLNSLVDIKFLEFKILMDENEKKMREEKNNFLY